MIVFHIDAGISHLFLCHRTISVCVCVCVNMYHPSKTVIQSLLMSRLDYCNAILIGIQQDLIAKLQQLQNSAARIVSRTRKYEHITPVLIRLH